MQEIINEKVSIVAVFDYAKKLFMPKKLKWQGKVYDIEKVGYHHRIREGRKLIHIFSVANKSTAFRLRFDTESLYWTLEEISDGFAS
jgi:hypothetical protein